MLWRFPQDYYTNALAIVDTMKAGAQTTTAPTDVVGTFNAPPPIQSVSFRPWGMRFRVMLIFQAIWTEVVTQLATLIMKVSYMESRVRS